ncbi:MAG: AI-2E family transporter, partial [Acidobacteria bacterium]|nr:AI-2E family transporter [Acidobacteriota bacterium]
SIVGISLAVMRVPGALVLGVLAGLFELIPFFGPVAAALPAIGIAMLDSPQKALYVLILFLIVQQLEGNVISPLLLQSRVDIPPALTIITVPALMIVFGLVGAMIAEPLLAIGLVLTRRLWVERHADRMA